MTVELVVLAALAAVVLASTILGILTNAAAQGLRAVVAPEHVLRSDLSRPGIAPHAPARPPRAAPAAAVDQIIERPQVLRDALRPRHGQPSAPGALEGAREASPKPLASTPPR